MVKMITSKEEKEQIARSILYDLSSWFGIPEALEEYILKSQGMPFIAVYCDGVAVGFVSSKATSDYTAEIYCMGVLKAYHGRGLGRKLFLEFEAIAKSKGYKYLQVKTVKYGKYETYDKTNLFYKAMGFSELEVFPTLWDENNPCQVYVKAIWNKLKKD